MFRRVLFPSLGALALLVALGAPGQVHAQRMRGGSTNRVMSGFRSTLRPVFPGRINPGFNRGMLNRGFNRGMVNRGMVNRGTFNRGMFNRGMFDRGFGLNRAFFNPGFRPSFTPGFFRPF